MIDINSLTGRRWKLIVSTTRQLMRVTHHAQRMTWHGRPWGNQETRQRRLKILIEREFIVTFPIISHSTLGDIIQSHNLLEAWEAEHSCFNFYSQWKDRTQKLNPHLRHFPIYHKAPNERPLLINTPPPKTAPQTFRFLAINWLIMVWFSFCQKPLKKATDKPSTTSNGFLPPGGIYQRFYSIYNIGH